MFSISRRFQALSRCMAAAALVLATAAGAPLARAQDADPPGRVARLSDAEGQVWVYTPESGDWIAAQANQVLTTGDRLATDAGARAELQVGSAAVRLDAGTEVAVQRLDDEHLVLQLVDGTAIARVRDPAAAGQFELNTDEGRFVLLRAGTYRFGRAASHSALTVYDGAARYEGPNSALPLEAGQRADFWIDAGGAAQYSTTAPVNDAFLAWSNERDRREQSTVAERYVSPEMTGAADLDAYGRWEQSDDYGPLWVPVVAADWAPYSQGHWAWVAPWGWTWIDDAPWGFAPFHYGRWVYVRNNWCWTPGSRVARPTYAPALVSWVGMPLGIGTTGAGPAVGWFALAPREVYVPSYRVSSRYAERVNISYVGNPEVIRNVFNNPQVPRDFANRGFPRAITVVPANVMAEHRPVGPAASQLRQAPWVRDLANGQSRPAPLLAPPVNAPSVVTRATDPRSVRPPPGFPERPAFSARPAPPSPPPSPRDRSADDRSRGARESHDSMRAGQVPMAPPQGGLQTPAPPTVGRPTSNAEADNSRRADPHAGIPPRPNMHALPTYRDDDRRPTPAPPSQQPVLRPQIEVARPVAPVQMPAVPQARSPAPGPVVPQPARTEEPRRVDMREQQR